MQDETLQPLEPEVEVPQDWSPLHAVEPGQRRGPAMPPTVSRYAGFVAAPQRFPDDPIVHQYDRLHPDQIDQETDARGRVHVVGKGSVSVHNEPALARTGVARLTVIHPRCDTQGRFYELSTGYADALGGVACQQCWPEAWEQTGRMPDTATVDVREDAAPVVVPSRLPDADVGRPVETLPW